MTPTEDPSTSQNVTFQGGEPDDVRGRIQFRTEGGPIRAVNAPIQPKAASNDYGHFSGTLTGLKPATDYQYRVAADGVWSEWQQFTTEDPNATDFSYLYYGDAQIGLNTTWPKVVQQALAKAPDAVGSVHAGDLIDTGGNDAQWQDWFAGMKTAAATTNVMAAPGNHEYSGDKLLTSWKAHFEYPHNNPNESTIGDLALRAVGDTPTAKQYRAFFDHWSDFAAETVYFTDYQGVRFITVNATRDSTFLTPDSLPACAAADCPAANISALWTQYQAQWLDYVLANSESKWNVVTFHQPVYSTSAGRDEKVLRDYWVPVFEKHDIDLVQMGHDHTYARGYKNTTATDVPGRTDGPVYIVSNSGAKHYDLETDAKNVWINNGATQVQKAQDVTTYQVIDVSKDKLTYRSYIAEINDSGTYYRNGQLLDAAQFEVGDLWDEFTVYKTDDGRKAVQEAEMAAPEFEDLSQTPELTTQPKALVKATHGDDVTLTVAAQADGELTYAWQRRPLAGGTWQDLRREDEASLLLEHVTPATARYEYRVAVSNGSKTVHSDASRIQVSKRKATITVAKANLKRGKVATVKVRADVTGRVQIVLTHGATTRLKSVKVTAGKTVTVKLGKLARKGGPKKASVALTLLADDEGYAVTRAKQKVALKR
ncbi:fibronectin type III domain-containing protein [Nocardioides sp. Bht2]|uniref:fibronectin type III domain-containing protein n=1 Tax=Nocardioides sp. Bht2 TaxID=3392297 RepID=UPI0039B4F4BD